MKLFTMLLAGLMACRMVNSLFGAAEAAPPEVSFVLEGPAQFWMRPDAGRRPSVVTGENFDVPGLEVWTWAPPSKEEDIRAAAPTADWTPPVLPQKPPSGAVRMTVLDAERQTLVVDLGRQRSNLLWVKTQHGISTPYLFGVACSTGSWLMDEELPHGGQTFGFGLGEHLHLVGPGGVFTPKRVYGPTSLIYFEVPAQTPPGEYQLYTHNSSGGAFGWKPAGRLKVTAPPERRVFQADEFGAKGDGRSNDFEALVAAMKAATAAGGGEVFLPPGTYVVEKTLELPAGVTLRGASRQNTVLKTVGPVAWAVRLGANSGLRDLTLTESQAVPGFRGLVGGGGEGMTIAGCELIPFPDSEHRYAVLIASPQARRFRLKDNILHGSLRIFWSGVTRAEIVGNTVLRGGFGGRPVSESVFARNILRDAPGRSAFDSTSRSLYELNEMHGFWFAPYPEHNWEEAMMSHGAGDKIIGSPTACTEASLTDDRQSWKPGEHRGKWVLVIEGRGFGQYRQVVENSKDTLTLEQPWRVRPDASSRYALGTYYVENIHRNNLIQGWGTFVLWLDQINNRLESLGTQAGGVTLWGRDSSRIDQDGKVHRQGSYNPSWYNVICDCSLESGNVCIETDDAAASANRGPVLFANLVANNRITAPHLRRASRIRGAEQGTHYQGPGPFISSNAGVALTDLKFLDTPGSHRRATHTIISGNYFVDAPFAVELQDVAGKTFVLNNQLQYVKTPILAGEQTLRQVRVAGNIAFTAEEAVLMRRELPDKDFGVPAEQ